LLKFDISSFFETISEREVYHVFHEAGYSELVSFELSRLCTRVLAGEARYKKTEWRAHGGGITQYTDERLGHLPQGAPTSPMLSNLVFKKTDNIIFDLCQSSGWFYSRYSDDISMSHSGRMPIKRADAEKMIGRMHQTLQKAGYTPNLKKTSVSPPGSRKIVLGLLVDSKAPRLSRKFRSRLEQHLYFITKYGWHEHASKLRFQSITGLYHHLKGLVSYACLIDPSWGDEMNASFLKLPPPNVILLAT